MKHKQTTIRVQLQLAMFASGGMAGGCMLVLCFFMLLASANKPFAIFFNRHVLLFIVLFLIIFVGLMVTFFQLLIRKKIRFLEEITKSLDLISGGNLDVRIPVRSRDEIGRMAGTVNEMALRLKTSLEEERNLEKSKNDLITSISHDLRTPLTSTLGYLDLISRTEYSDEESMRSYSAIALDQCRDLKGLIDELFEYSRVSNPDMSVSKIRISIGEFLEQVILGFIPAFESAGMECRLRFIHEKLMVEADPMLMKRVFDNLIGNAVRYGKDGKYVDIELGRENNFAVIRIITHNRTIPAQDLPHIFERYYQAGHATTGLNGGSGLGLAIVKSILSLHDGTIQANCPDNSTVFEIKLGLAANNHLQRC